MCRLRIVFDISRNELVDFDTVTRRSVQCTANHHVFTREKHFHHLKLLICSAWTHEQCVYTSVSRERNKKRRKMLWHIQGWLPITFYFEFPIFALVDGEYLNKRFGADFFLPPSRSSVWIFFSFVIAKSEREKERHFHFICYVYVEVATMNKWTFDEEEKKATN